MSRKVKKRRTLNTVLLGGLMKGLKTFIKNVIENYKEDSKFAGCYYFNLKQGLYLVFACGDSEEEGLLGKIARNCDDLQCDFDWDWKTVEDWYWEEPHCEESDPEDIEKSVRRIIEPSWLTAYREFCDKEYDQWVEAEEGEILNVLYSTFDVGEDLDDENYLEVEIQVSYNPIKYQYIVDLTERHTVDLGEETDEEKHSFTIAQDHEGFYDDMYCNWQTLYEYFAGEARDRFYPED